MPTLLESHNVLGFFGFAEFWIGTSHTIISAALLSNSYLLLDVLTVVALICYAFAVLGVFLFGGLINDDPNDPNYEAVAKSSYGQADYKVNNFNDIGMGVSAYLSTSQHISASFDISSSYF